MQGVYLKSEPRTRRYTRLSETQSRGKNRVFFAMTTRDNAHKHRNVRVVNRLSQLEILVEAVMNLLELVRDAVHVGLRPEEARAALRIRRRR